MRRRAVGKASCRDEGPGEGMRAGKRAVYGVESQLEPASKPGANACLSEPAADAHPEARAARVSRPPDRLQDCRRSGPRAGPPPIRTAVVGPPRSAASLAGPALFWVRSPSRPAVIPPRRVDRPVGPAAIEADTVIYGIGTCETDGGCGGSAKGAEMASAIQVMASVSQIPASATMMPTAIEPMTVNLTCFFSISWMRSRSDLSTSLIFLERPAKDCNSPATAVTMCGSMPSGVVPFFLKAVSRSRLAY